MIEAIETATTVRQPMQCDPAELARLDHAAFRFAFFEECQAAGPKAPVDEPFNRAMVRVRRFLEAQSMAPSAGGSEGA